MTRSARALKPSTYDDFQDILTAYRMSFALLSAHDLGVFKVLSNCHLTPSDLCEKTGMNPDYGLRFLEVLAFFGLLEKENGHIGLSPFSRRFLDKGSREVQDISLDFEKKLVTSWQNLSTTLRAGKRIFNASEKSRHDYGEALSMYINSMDDAAKIRSVELWDRIDSGESGLIMDAGAGSGAYLAEFLLRNPGWQGVFCDLPDVITKALSSAIIRPFLNRLSFRAVNFLEPSETLTAMKADIILCSNLVHCQGGGDTRGLLSRLLPLLSANGRLIIHDFISDRGLRGALYDLHMMLNTYNGRTYTVSEICAMVGLSHLSTIDLPSGSCALVFSDNQVRT